MSIWIELQVPRRCGMFCYQLNREQIKGEALAVCFQSQATGISSKFSFNADPAGNALESA